MVQAGRTVHLRHLKPRIIMFRQSRLSIVNPDPHGKPPHSALLSVAKILVWLLEEWYSKLFLDNSKSLLICDRYYHDLLVDPIRYRYSGPRWAASLVGKLIPKPDLWVLLDVPAALLQKRKQEVPPEESERQRQAYLAFVTSQRNYAVINSSQSLSDVIAEAESVILKATSESKGNRG
jgi:thymidylate kinase